MHKYYIVKTEKTTCLNCKQKVFLLATMFLTGPAFYVCFHCQIISEIGVGKVLTELPVNLDEQPEEER